MPVFKEVTGYPDKAVIRALGNLVVHMSCNFTSLLQPIVVKGELVYGITRYGSKDLLIIRDNEKWTPYDNGIPNVDLLPLGLRKAAAIEKDIHRKNVKRFGLENVDPSCTRYYPNLPQVVYHRAERNKRLAEMRAGRCLLFCIKCFDLIITPIYWVWRNM